MNATSCLKKVEMKQLFSYTIIKCQMDYAFLGKGGCADKIPILRGDMKCFYTIIMIKPLDRLKICQT